MKRSFGHDPALKIVMLSLAVFLIFEASIASHFILRNICYDNICYYNYGRLLFYVTYVVLIEIYC